MLWRCALNSTSCFLAPIAAAQEKAKKEKVRRTATLCGQRVWCAATRAARMGAVVVAMRRCSSSRRGRRKQAAMGGVHLWHALAQPAAQQGAPVSLLFRILSLYRPQEKAKQEKAAAAKRKSSGAAGRPAKVRLGFGLQVLGFRDACAALQFGCRGVLATASLQLAPPACHALLAPINPTSASCMQNPQLCAACRTQQLCAACRTRQLVCPLPAFACRRRPRRRRSLRRSRRARCGCCLFVGGCLRWLNQTSYCRHQVVSAAPSGWLVRGTEKDFKKTRPHTFHRISSVSIQLQPEEGRRRSRRLILKLIPSHFLQPEESEEESEEEQASDFEAEELGGKKGGKRGSAAKRGRKAAAVSDLWWTVGQPLLLGREGDRAVAAPRSARNELSSLPWQGAQ